MAVGLDTSKVVPHHLCRAGQSAVVSELCTWNLVDGEQQQQQQQQQEEPAGRSGDSTPAPPRDASEGARHLPDAHGTTPTPCSQPWGPVQPRTPCSPHAPKRSPRPGGRCRLLSIVLTRPDLAEEERQFKKGERCLGIWCLPRHTAAFPTHSPSVCTGTPAGTAGTAAHATYTLGLKI